MSEREIHRDEIGDAPGPDRGALRGFLFLAGSPLAFLFALSLRYVLTDPACAGAGGRIALELTTLIGLAAAVLAVHHGWKRISGRGLVPISEAAEDGIPFVATFGLLIGLLFLVASTALWLPSLFLSPCGAR